MSRFPLRPRARPPGRVRRHRRPAVAGAGVGYLLLLLALIPLSGSSWFAATEIASARRARDQAEQVEAAVSELVELTELRSALLDERNWYSVSYGVQSFGMSPATVRGLSGIDLLDETADARLRVDALVAGLGLDDVAADLRRARSDDVTRMLERAEPFTELEERIAASSATLLEDLLADAADITDGSELVRTLLVLDAAALARQSLAGEQTFYFSGRYSPEPTTEVDLRMLTEHRALHSAALADAAAAQPDSAAARAIDAIETSPQVARFDAEIERYLGDSFADGLETSSMENLLAGLGGVAAMFRAVDDASKLHLALVEAAATDVEQASRALSDEAAARTSQALLTAICLTLASLTFVLAVSRVVAAPIRQLAEAANDLRDGHSGIRMKPSGPSEVRTAALALNEMSDHLDLVRRQATALAEGQLDHEVLSREAPGELGRSLQEAVRTLADSIAERERFRLRLAYEADHDALTGLPNRKSCLTRLEEALADRTNQLAALFIDLDGFKDINDDHGHQAGDAVLVATAERLQESVRDGDHVGRLGGDEFLVVAAPIADRAEATALAERLVAAVVRPITTGGTVVRVEASIGVAFPSPGRRDPDELIREADLALYEAKESGRGRVVLCDDRLLAVKDEQVALELALRRAISHDELTLHYQPIVDAATHGIVSLEALLRWDQPGRGLIDPERFIAIAERSELITILDRWVFAAVAAQLDQWRNHQVLGQVPIAVNISGRTLSSTAVVDDILDPLHHFGISPHRLVVEITESAVVEDLDLAAERLHRLRANGTRVAIDDYGTGYTSLAHLRTLPVDMVKIDRSFVDDETSGRLARLIIDTGHLLGATVTAEGVETPAQAQRLRSLGSDRLQGFLFGRPSPPEHYTRFTTPTGPEPGPT